MTTPQSAPNRLALYATGVLLFLFIPAVLFLFVRHPEPVGLSLARRRGADRRPPLPRPAVHGAGAGGQMPLVQPGPAADARGARAPAPAAARLAARCCAAHRAAGGEVLLLPPLLALAVAAGDLPSPALPAHRARRLRRRAAGSGAARHHLVQAGGRGHGERGRPRLFLRPRARPPRRSPSRSTTSSCSASGTCSGSSAWSGSGGSGRGYPPWLFELSLKASAPFPLFNRRRGFPKEA